MKIIASSENIEDFLNEDFIYVDKTEYIYNLIRNHSRVFFSRPRRFGKSLTLNTIGTLFEKGVEPYFRGTWIYDKWEQHTFPVLRLSFLKFSVTDFSEFNHGLCQTLRDFAREQNIELYADEQKATDLIRSLFNAMPDGRQIVLLIDEYDCQLTANINNKELYERYILFIREMYAILKGEKHIKFMAVTGVTRLKDVSIFSVGSDIKDLTYDHAFSKMIGFTRDEIRKFYLDYLKLGVSYAEHTDISSVTDDEVEKFLDRMAEHYDGYCFDEFYENKVFSTYSVNCFLKALYQKERVVFGDYWYEAGGVPSILRNYLESHEVNLLKFLAAAIDISYESFMNPTTLTSMDENVLMCQTGYLTLKSPIDRNVDITLGTANREVRTALCSLLALRVFSKNISPYNQDRQYVLQRGTAEDIVYLFNTVLSAVSYDKYPITDESVLRALLQLYLIGKNHDVRVEQHNFKGRSDLIVNFDRRRIVIELKFSKDGSDTDRLLQEASAQLSSREYGTENLGSKELLGIACVFNGAAEVRKITSFSEIRLR